MKISKLLYTPFRKPFGDLMCEMLRIDRTAGRVKVRVYYNKEFGNGKILCDELKYSNLLLSLSVRVFFQSHVLYL